MNNRSLLISAGQDATIRFWDAGTQRQLDVVPHKDAQVNCMAISPDGNQLATGTWERVHLYDTNCPTVSNAAQSTFTVHEKNVTTLGYQADGIWIFTGAEDGMAKIWDKRTGPLSCQRIFQVELVIADSSGSLYLWDLRSDRDDSLMTEMDHSEHAIHVEIDQTGRQCAAVTNRGNMFMWNMNSGTLREATGPSPPPAHLEHEADEQSKFTDDNGQPLLLMPSLGVEPPLIDSTTSNYGVMSYHTDVPFTLMKNVRPSAKVRAHRSYALKCHFTPDGLNVATTSADHSIRIWNANDCQFVKEFRLSSERWIWDCAFTNDGKYMVTASSDGILRMLDFHKKTVVRKYEGHSMGVTAIAFRDASD